MDIIRHHPVPFIHISSFHLPLLLILSFSPRGHLSSCGVTHKVTFKPENETGSDAAVQHGVTTGHRLLLTYSDFKSIFSVWMPSFFYSRTLTRWC